MPCEPNDLHASHFYAKRKRNCEVGLGNAENEEENPPELPKDKKKVKKLKEKSFNHTNKNYSQMQNITNFIKEPNGLIPLYNDLNELMHPEKIYAISPSNILNSNNESIYADLWNKIDNEESVFLKKYKGKHGTSSFKTPYKQQKNMHIEGFENVKQEDGNGENVLIEQNEGESNNFEDLMANFGIEHKNCNKEMIFEDFEEEEEQDQIENDFGNKDFNDFNGFIREEGP